MMINILRQGQQYEEVKEKHWDKLFLCQYVPQLDTVLTHFLVWNLVNFTEA